MNFERAPLRYSMAAASLASNIGLAAGLQERLALFYRYVAGESEWFVSFWKSNDREILKRTGELGSGSSLVLRNLLRNPKRSVKIADDEEGVPSWFSYAIDGTPRLKELMR